MPRLFLSASMGFAALRLFLFEARGCSFPVDGFLAEVAPWIEGERSDWSAAGETLEGAGCWSPLFPARSDDVWLAAVATVKHFERSMDGDPQVGLTVLEQLGGTGAGFQIARGGNVIVRRVFEDAAQTFRVVLRDEVVKHMFRLCDANRTQETGGILIGSYSHD